MFITQFINILTYYTLDSNVPAKPFDHHGPHQAKWWVAYYELSHPEFYYQNKETDFRLASLNTKTCPQKPASRPSLASSKFKKANSIWRKCYFSLYKSHQTDLFSDKSKLHSQFGKLRPKQIWGHVIHYFISLTL